MKKRSIFKNTGLKKKLLLLYLCVFLFPLVVLNIFIYRNISESMLEKMMYSARQSYEQAKDYLEYQILQLIYLSDVVASNKEIKACMESDNLTIHQQLAARDNIVKILQSIEGGQQNVDIRLYLPEVLRGVQDGESIRNFPEHARWYMNKREKKVYFAPGIELGETGKIALVRDIVSDNDYTRRIGAMRIDFDADELRKILGKASVTPNTVTYLINSEETVVAASDDDKVKELTDLEDDLRLVSEDAEKGMSGEIKKSNVYFMQSSIQNTDWVMVTAVPASDMLNEIIKTQQMMLAVMILFVFLTIIAGAAAITRFYNRIRCLADNMKQVESGKFDISLPDESGDEIGMLYSSYRSMLMRLKELMEEKYQMGKQLKSAELKALQSQINPHFLYNTLDTINWLAYAGKTEDVSSAVVALSKYYRLILNRGEDVLTLEEELKHVMYYIRLQQMRYPGRISYDWEVHPDILDAVVPKIILQPLVENAVKYGILESREKKGTIVLRGYADEKDDIYMTISDDGAGMSETALKKIMSGKIASSGSGYGVKNVNARIELMFGAGYGLSYESTLGNGTKVTIKIKKMMKNQLK